jgi:hypothetical protein
MKQSKEPERYPLSPETQGMLYQINVALGYFPVCLEKDREEYIRTLPYTD